MIDLNNIAKQSLKIAEHRKLETDALSCIKHCAGEIAEATQAIDNYQSCVCEETEKNTGHFLLIQHITDAWFVRFPAMLRWM